MIYNLILFFFCALSLCVAVMIFGEIKKYLWVNKYLTRPFKRYKKSHALNQSASMQRFGVSTDSQLSLRYYDCIEQKILEKLLFTIRLKSKNEIGNKSFVSFLTSGIIPFISLIIALVALFSSALSSNQIFLLAMALFALGVPVLFIIGLDYISQQHILTNYEKHALAIEEVLKAKQNPRARNRRR